MKTSWKIGAIIGVVATISMATIGVAYANTVSITPDCNSQSLCKFSWVEPNDDGTARNKGNYNPIDPGDNGADPKTAQAPGVLCTRASGNVASTTATFTTCTITINLSNAYPGYHPTIFFGFSNQNTTAGVVSSITFNNVPNYITMTLNGISKNQVIGSGKEVVGALDTAVSNDAPQTMMGKTYNMSVTIVITQSTQQSQNKTTTCLSATPNPSVFGQSITFTASVSPKTATGSVIFDDGSTSLSTVALSNGSASISTNKLAIGSHNITAIYSGDSNFASSTSNVVVQKVRSKTVCSWPVKPGPCNFGQTCTFKVQIGWQGASNPTGTVTFFDGSNSIGAGSWSGDTAVLNCSLSAGSHNITAKYSGDDNYDSSTSDVVTQTVNKVGSVITLKFPASPAKSGSQVTFTATVNPNSATGTVTFKDGNASIGTGNLSGEQVTFSTKLSPGTHSITAVYGGDTNFSGSTSNTVNQVINK